MEYYIDLIASKKWIFYIIYFSFIILIVYISIIIDERFGGLHKFIIRTYLIYLPVGLFMASYYLITEKTWLSKNNTYTLSFIYYSIMMLFNAIGEKSLKKGEYRLKRANERFENSRWIMLIVFIIVVPYTFTGFIKLLLKWAI